MSREAEIDQRIRREMIHFDATQKGPLDGVRVLDLSRLVAGNMLSLQLADLGAEVTKVEPPHGDPLRDWLDQGQPLFWKTYARNKRSIVLNLRIEAGKEALLRLSERADVLIENFRPGTLEQMALGPDVFLARNPDLILVRISGFGQTGPLCAAARIRHARRGDERACGAHRLCRPRAGAAAAGARRHDRRPLWRQCGRDGAVCARARPRAWASHRSVAARIDLLRARPGSRDFSHHRQAQGAHRKRLEHHGAAQRLSLRRRQIRGDVRFDPEHGQARVRSDRPRRDDRGRALSHQQRSRAQPALVDEAVGQWFALRTREQALAHMRAAGVTVGPVYDIDDAIEDAHFRERNILVEVEDGDLGSIPMHNIVPRLSATPGVWRRAAPRLGEHTDAILGEAGYDAEAIAALRRQGAAA